jgi:hypothetical protein
MVIAARPLLIAETAIISCSIDAEFSTNACRHSTLILEALRLNSMTEVTIEAIEMDQSCECDPRHHRAAA